MLTDESFSRLTLRDYFAACALQGMLSNSATTANMAIVQPSEIEKQISVAVYVMADAMLEGRKQ